MSKQKIITVEVISLEPLKVNKIEHAYGWDEEGVAEKVSAIGKIANIVISENDVAQFGIRILEDGSIILTSYQTLYTQAVERTLRLTNIRPWE